MRIANCGFWSAAPLRRFSHDAFPEQMKILIVGTGGRLGAALLREYHGEHDVAGFNHAQLDLSSFDKIREKLGGTDFDVLINAAAFTNVDLCEQQPDRAFRINAEAPRVLAEICGEKNAKLIHFSTDYVFDGEKRAPYTEEDEANPISVYGESKLAGEKNVLATGDQHLVVRVSWVFGPDRSSFIDGMIKRAQESETVDAITDKFSTPTYTHDVAKMLSQFFDSDVEGGILHFANAGRCSWQEYAQWALDCCDKAGLSLKSKTVGACRLKDMANWIARRPVYSVLSTAKYTQLTGISPRTWREAVADYITRFYSKK
ncbi:MAG: dTDP-4-dehydrorhamnose reductase [Verrucomicrobia bacterium]|nr:MAG: dTDP-4-dehydrorhamnose reductase [Verrucomicrobiota bacterium]